MTTIHSVSPMGPITPHGSTVVNVAFDSTVYALKKNNGNGSHWQFRNDSDGIVVKGDLVFRYKDGPKRKRVSYNEPDLKVFSTVNGLPVAKDKKAARDQVSFIGVANNDLVPGPSKHTSATVAGLITIKNTGPVAINAGEKIVWDFPDEADKTVGRKTFITLPYHKAISKDKKVMSFATALGNAMIGKGVVEPEVKACNDLFNKPDKTDFVKCVVETSRELDSRIIGVAMSDASQNEMMDVLIRYGK